MLKGNTFNDCEIDNSANLEYFQKRVLRKTSDQHENWIRDTFGLSSDCYKENNLKR